MSSFLKRRNRNADPLLGTHMRSAVDGSGRSVSMEAPIITSARNASSYTRASYLWLLVSIIAIIWSWRGLWYHYATTFLECKDLECTLKIIPPGREKMFTLKFSKEQLISAKKLIVDKDGELMANTSYTSNGTYESYGIILHQEGLLDGEWDVDDDFDMDGGTMASDAAFEKQRKALLNRNEDNSGDGLSKQDKDDFEKDKFEYNQILIQEKERKDRQRQEHQKQKFAKRKVEIARRKNDYPSLESLYHYALPQDEDGHYLVMLRKYSVLHKRRRVSSLINKINLYIKGTKKDVLIRENREVVWQGILGIVSGFFSILLALLLGQFADPVRRKKFKTNSSRNYGGYGGVNSNGNIASLSNRNQTATRQRSYKAKSYGGYKPA